MGVYNLEGEYYHHWSRPTSAVLMAIDTQASPKCAVLLVSAYLLSDAVPLDTSSHLFLYSRHTI